MVQNPQRRLLLGLTGGIAAYKSAEFVRLAVASGFSVQVVMTEAATRFVTPLTLQALSGKAVFRSLWDKRVANNMAHIDLAREAEVILIAPASANFLAKLAQGLADDLLSTLCLARTCPLIVAPAMNREMWAHPATQRNVSLLKQDGIRVVEPESGAQACGEIGPGRMVEPPVLLDEVITTLAPKLFTGVRILITAGPTWEPVDPVRVITNLSSGKMGYAVAQAAQAAGAKVTLVTGPTYLTPPRTDNTINVATTEEMRVAVLREVSSTDVFISIAAVADFKINMPAKEKLKKHRGELDLKLVPTPDILAEVATLPRAPFCVGFAAETTLEDQQVESKRRAKNVPLMVANQVPQAFGSDENELVLFDDAGRHLLPRGSKLTLARLLLEHIASLMHERNLAQSKTPTLNSRKKL